MHKTFKTSYSFDILNVLNVNVIFLTCKHQYWNTVIEQELTTKIYLY